MQTDVRTASHVTNADFHPQELEAHNGMLKNQAPMKLKPVYYDPPSQVCKLFYLTRTNTKSLFSKGENVLVIKLTRTKLNCQKSS